jgi:RHS repeat-associated protein
MDSQSRIALVRVGDAFPGDSAPNVKVKYHLGDHLGSSSVVIDENGAWVNREEYFPYGETSFGSFARKRYRFTGKEQDEESGLYYHGARYYASRLLRWVNCDPAGMVDGSNLYQYTTNNSVRFHDPTGSQSEEAQNKGKEQEKDRVLHGLRPPPGVVTDRPIPQNTVVRKIDPLKEKDPTKYGMRTKDPSATLRPAEHALNEHLGGGTPYMAASRRPGGAPRIDGKRYWIDLDQAPDVAEITTNEIIQDVDEYVKERPQRTDLPYRASKYKFAQSPTNPKREMEVLLTGEVPACAVQSAAQRYLRMAEVAVGPPMSMAGGGLTIYQSAQSDSLGVQIIGSAAGATEMTGGIMYAAGAAGGSAEAVALGGRLMRFGGWASLILTALLTSSDNPQFAAWQKEQVEKGIASGALVRRPILFGLLEVIESKPK